MALKPKSFGTALKNARKENQLTQAELAEKLDISLSYLKDLEYFKSQPSLELFVNVIETLNLSADDVIHPENNKNNSTYKKSIVCSSVVMNHSFILFLQQQKLLFIHLIKLSIISLTKQACVYAVFLLQFSYIKKDSIAPHSAIFFILFL